MNDFISRCFVCQERIDPEKSSKNEELNLGVCIRCKGSDQEREKVKELLDGLADGFSCGCI